MNISQEKSLLMAKVAINFLFQLTVSLTVAENVAKYSGIVEATRKNRLILLLAEIILIIIISFVEMPLFLKFSVMTLLSTLVGATIYDIDDIKTVLKELTIFFTSSLVLGLVVTACGINLKYLGIILLFASLSVFLFRLTGAISSKKYTTLMSSIIAALIVYDTQNILSKEYDGDFIDASLDYFSNAISYIRINERDDD